MDENLPPQQAPPRRHSRPGDGAGEAGATSDDAAQLASELLDALGHDLRSPIGAVLMWVEVLRRGPAAEGDVAKALDMIERSARSMVASLDALADTRAALAGDVAAPCEDLDLGALASSTAAGLALEAGERSVTLEIDASAGPACVTASPLLLRRALEHVLASMLLDAPHGATLEVRTGARDGDVECRLVVRPGAPATNGTASCSRRASLGTRIAQRLVELQGGSLRREGGPDVEVTIRFPLERSPCGGA